MATPARDLREWIALLEREGELRRISAEGDPDLKITEIVDRVVQASDSPAALRARVLLWDSWRLDLGASESDESSFGDGAGDFCAGCAVVALARKLASRAASWQDTRPSISSRRPGSAVEGVYPEATAVPLRGVLEFGGLRV